MESWNNFESWRDILEWVKDNGFKRLAKWMTVNNACYWSSGEFGRAQAMICDSIRLAYTEDDALVVAEELEQETSEWY